MEEHKIFILLKDYTQQSLITKYGIHLAKEIKTKAFLLGIGKITSSATPTPVQASILPYPTYVDAKAMRTKILSDLKRIQLEAKEIWEEVYCEVAIGLSNSRVISITEEKDPTLLVIEGRNDLTTFREWFGTYETKIAENVNCPVLVVQPNTEWKPIKNILYLIDLDDAKVENMRTLTTLTQKLDAHLQVIFVSEKNRDEADGSYQQMVNVFKNVLGFKAPTYHRIFGEKRSSEVAGLVEALAPDWLAFEQKNKNFFKRLYDDYNTKRLILQSDIPTLVF